MRGRGRKAMRLAALAVLLPACGSPFDLAPGAEPLPDAPETVPDARDDARAGHPRPDAAAPDVAPPPGDGSHPVDVRPTHDAGHDAVFWSEDATGPEDAGTGGGDDACAPLYACVCPNCPTCAGGAGDWCDPPVVGSAVPASCETCLGLVLGVGGVCAEYHPRCPR